jgi:hypothetical protein
LTPPDPETVRRDALSGHPMLRRNAARVHTLPADLVARLAVDDDLGVRVLLTQNHPDAPPPLLLRSFLEYTGHQRDHLLTRPHFPIDGLAVHADDEDPAVRALAARDPKVPPAAVERLTRDPDPAVRAAFARHPNLPAVPAGGVPRRRGAGPPRGRQPGVARTGDPRSGEHLRRVSRRRVALPEPSRSPGGG